MGLYHKFITKRVDGTDAPGGKHDKCFYSVIDATHDPHAKPTLLAYAKACKKSLPVLSFELEEMIKGRMQWPTF